jgi:cyclohexanone monooxygenase
MNAQGPKTGQQVFDVFVVGAGFAGIYALYKYRSLGMTVKGAESGTDVGGTWYWNRYPGARCDTESMQYSYSWDPQLSAEWEWSERFPGHAEIRSYLEHVADRHDLKKHIDFETRIASMEFDDALEIWTIQSEDGKIYRARCCVMATGCMVGAVNSPEFRGAELFGGQIYHTARWPKENVEFSGKRVAVIGTGSSGIQTISEVAKSADKVYVYQRTPNFSIPARNEPMRPEHQQYWKENYALLRDKARNSRSGTLFDFGTIGVMDVDETTRDAILQERWKMGTSNFMGSFNDMIFNDESNAVVADFVRSKIAETVKDPKTAEQLTPQGYPIFAKRICLDTEYFETFNRDNVALIDVKSDPIVEITPVGIRTEQTEHEVDIIVFATGYDAITGPLMNIDIRGTTPKTIKEKWATGPYAYLGIMSSGFPNMFTITGPGSPSTLGNMVVSIEQHIEWVADLLVYMRDRQLTKVDADAKFEAEWAEHVTDVAETTVYPKASSWYMGANIPGKRRVFLPYIGGIGHYRKLCDEVARKGYEGFTFGSRDSSESTKQAS